MSQVLQDGGTEVPIAPRKGKDDEKVAEHSQATESRGSKLATSFRHRLANIISASPVEERGVMPVALEDRTATNYNSYFSIWVCMNINLLP